MASATSIEALERLGAAAGGGATPGRRMLVIVNPYATTVSDRLKNLIVYALRGRYEVHAVDTQARDHATELCRAAADEGYDVVCAFGGDGTLNEAANGLAGSGTPLTCLPGGSTNVYCRMLGIPIDIVDATEHLLSLADDWRPRTLDLAKVNERRFLFSSGLGLDASVVQRVDAHPRLKARAGDWYFTWVTTSIFIGRYLRSPPRMAVQVDGERHEGITTIVQNGSPYSYFGARPLEIGEGATLHSGDLAGVVLRGARLLDGATIAWRTISHGARVAGHRRVEHFRGARSLQIRSLDDRPLPLQVDGDYIGEVAEVRYSVEPGALTVVA